MGRKFWDCRRSSIPQLLLLVIFFCLSLGWDKELLQKCRQAASEKSPRWWKGIHGELRRPSKGKSHGAECQSVPNIRYVLATPTVFPFPLSLVFTVLPSPRSQVILATRHVNVEDCDWPAQVCRVQPTRSVNVLASLFNINENRLPNHRLQLSSHLFTVWPE